MEENQTWLMERFTERLCIKRKSEERRRDGCGVNLRDLSLVCVFVELDKRDAMDDYVMSPHADEHHCYFALLILEEIITRTTKLALTICKINPKLMILKLTYLIKNRHILFFPTL